MKKHYTLTEYCHRFSVDPSTRRKMTKISLLQQRTAGEKGFTRGARLPLEFWKELHSKADNTSRIPSLFFSVPGYLRKTPAMETPAPEPVTVPEKGRSMAFPAAEGHGLLGFMLGALSGAAVAVACVLCCF